MLKPPAKFYLSANNLSPQWAYLLISFIYESASTFESCYPDEVFVWNIPTVTLAKVMKDYFNILTTLKSWSDTQLQGP